MLAFFMCGCERESRSTTTHPTPTEGQSLTISGLYAGGVNPPDADPAHAQYEHNAYHLSQGQRLYEWFNCVGCHAHGGGGMGPPHIDDQWRYGSSIEQIYASIVQGRPNGMPSFRGKIPDEQVWEIAGYVKSMSGNVERAAAPAREDHMSVQEPPNDIDKAPPIDSSKGSDVP